MITEEQEQNLRDKAHSYLAMEIEVYEISRMARATALVLDVYMEEKREAAKREFFTGPEVVKHLDDWSDSVDFMVHHLREMAVALRRHYQ